MKRIIALVLAAVTAFSMAVPAVAEEMIESEAETIETFEFSGPGIIDVMDFPVEYRKEDAQNMGRVERLDYQNDYGNKYIFVYLPYGYDENDDSYNVYYLIHGGNGQPEVFLQDSHTTATQKVFDNAFQNGDIEPFIIVSSSWNPAKDDAGNDIVPDGETPDSAELTRAYVQELEKYILPLVEGTYRTYAENTDEEGLTASRGHRAFGGFSMGGVTTWNVFMELMKYFRYFVPESGDCWALSDDKGSDPEMTAQALADAVTAQGYTADDFVIYAFTGTQDIAMPNLGPQIIAMGENEMFRMGENTFFGVLDGGEHNEMAGRRYRFTGAHYIFDK